MKKGNNNKLIKIQFIADFIESRKFTNFVNTSLLGHILPLKLQLNTVTYAQIDGIFEDLLTDFFATEKGREFHRLKYYATL